MCANTYQIWDLKAPLSSSFLVDVYFFWLVSLFLLRDQFNLEIISILLQQMNCSADKSSGHRFFTRFTNVNSLSSFFHSHRPSCPRLIKTGLLPSVLLKPPIHFKSLFRQFSPPPPSSFLPSYTDNEHTEH